VNKTIGNDAKRSLAPERVGNIRTSNPLELTPEDLSPAQCMWIDAIHGVVNQPRFELGIGDMAYVLSNMIAKMVSSSKYYFASTGAIAIIRDMGLDINQPIHIAKYLYGSKKMTMLEHMIPASILRAAILDGDKTKSEIEFICRNAGVVTVVTRGEDKGLSKAGLSRKMPENWRGIGDNPLKRYSVAGITLSDLRIIPMGPICR